MVSIKSKFSRFTASVNINTGLGQISLKIPGTFNGLTADLNNNAITNGRVVSDITVFLGSPANSDYLSALNVEDTDGVVPVGQRGIFPDYPILWSLLDLTVPAGNRGYYFTSEALFIANNQRPFFIPSATYLIIRAQKTPPAADNLYVNISSIVET